MGSNLERAAEERAIDLRIERTLTGTPLAAKIEWTCDCAERALGREQAAGRAPWIVLYEVLSEMRAHLGPDFSREKWNKGKEKRSKKAWGAVWRSGGGLSYVTASAVAHAADGHCCCAASHAACGYSERSPIDTDLDERRWQENRLRELSKKRRG